MNLKNLSIVVVSIAMITCSSCKKSIETSDSTITDIDGNVYHTVTNGTQVWMVENLRVANYNNGDPIPNIVDSLTWVNLSMGAYCWYNNDSATYNNPYGKLYNWYTVNTGKLCPIGWHLPTYAQLTTLVNYLGGENIAGGKLKETGTAHWNTPNTGATNEAGFTALPSGVRYNGIFARIGEASYLMSATQYNSGFAWHIGIYYNNSRINPGTGPVNHGFSVRCLKD
jgi:uncharacterized protein (TIGR02145 family)